MLSFWTFVATVASAFVLHIVFLTYRRRKFFRNLPGPPHSWLLGHLGAMGEMSQLVPHNCHPQILLTEMTRRYDLPPVFYVDLWPAAKPMVIITGLEDMNYVQVLKPHDQHRDADDFLAPILGHDVVAVANGKTWKMLRNAMNPSFAPAHIKNSNQIVVEECMTFRETLSKLAERGEVFDLEQESAKMIFDVIARIVFSYPLEAQKKGSQTLNDLRTMVKLTEARLSMNPFVKMKAWWMRQKVLTRLNAEVQRQIRARYELLRDEKVVPSRRDPHSTLDLMLREQLMQSDGVRDLDPEFEKLLVTNVKGLLLGGHGTTTDTICFIFMLLSKNPAVVQKLRAEHDKVFDPDFNRTVEKLIESPYTLNELDYTTAVIKESMRLFPVGFGVRAAHEWDAMLPSTDGNQYPLGHDLCIVNLAHHLHYSPEIYPNPTVFYPERFMDPDTVPRGAFRSFSRGPRGCAGQELAIDEMRIILLMIMRDYEFEYHGFKPNKESRVRYTDLDSVYGDAVFQELAMEAKPRDGMKLKVRKVKR